MPLIAVIILLSSVLSVAVQVVVVAAVPKAEAVNAVLPRAFVYKNIKKRLRI